MKSGHSVYYWKVPFEIDGKKVSGLHDLNDDTLMLFWKDADEQMFRSYSAQLDSLGFQKRQSLDNEAVVSAT